jgi:hypothetical protein
MRVDTMFAAIRRKRSQECIPPLAIFGSDCSMRSPNRRGDPMQTSYEQNTSTDNGQQWREGRVARSIERQTAKVPSDVFLWAALAAMGGSLAAQIVGMRSGMKMMGMGGMTTRAPLSTFIGQWVPTLLLLGVYNKIVKVHGSDRSDR